MSQNNPVSRDELVAVGAAVHILQAGAFVELVQDTQRFGVIAAESVIGDDLLVRRCLAHGQLISSDRLPELDQIVQLFGGEALLKMKRAPGSRTRIGDAGVELLKLAGFLPLGILMPLVDLPQPPMITVRPEAVEAFPTAMAQSLEAVSDASVPLHGTGQARFVAFRSRLGGPQHYAIIVGEPDLSLAPLCRLHSECFTGDIFSSMRCDCGEQLNGAILKMAKEGGGILLYLSQEGRGIGLVNKLRAYRLQDQGVDTVDANTQLGFEPDERNFTCAARLLELLGATKVQLMTNNPAKIEALTLHGIDVVGRVAHSFEANDHNHFYLETKAKRSGHLIDLVTTTTQS